MKKKIYYEDGFLYTRGWVLNKVYNTEEFEEDEIYRTNLYNIPMKMAVDLILVYKSWKKAET